MNTETLYSELNDAERWVVDRIRAMAVARIHAGRGVYGPWDPRTDKRDMMRELQEELVDGMVYSAMDAVRKGMKP